MPKPRAALPATFPEQRGTHAAASSHGERQTARQPVSLMLVKPIFRTQSSIRIAAVAASVAFVVPLAACAGDTGEGGSADPSTLVYASGDAEPTCLDPHVGGNWPQALAGNQFLESLFTRDEAGEVQPWLAEEATPSTDGLTWDITLKPDIVFSDGTPFDAASVVRNVEHVKDPATKSSTGVLALAKVASVEAVDEHTARFHLSEPDSALLASLAQTWLAIEAPSGLDRGETENCLAPIGTGAYKVETWTKQDRITFLRNDSHTATLPDEVADASQTLPEGVDRAGFDRIEWRFIPDSATRLAALQSGEAHVIDSVQPDALAQLENDDRFGTLLGARPGTSARIELNTTRAPFSDIAVREAFVRAADIDASVESLFFGTIERSTSPLASSLPESRSFPDELRHDPDEANRLLDEAGYTERDADGYRTRDGQRLTVAFPLSTNQSIPAEISLAEQLAAAEREVGIDVQIETLDLASWYDRSGTWSFDAIIAPYSKSSADVLRIVYHTDGIAPAPSGYHANNTGRSDPALDRILDDAGREQDATKRTALYEEAQRNIIESYTVLPLYDQMVQFAYTTSLGNFVLQPNLNLPRLSTAWLAED